MDAAQVSALGWDQQGLCVTWNHLKLARWGRVLLTKTYYVNYGCQATILKANEKLNEEERARGRGREERVNLYFPLLPFPFLYFKPVVLSLESFIALPQLFINLGEHYSQEKCHHSHCKIHLLCRQGCF